MGHIKALEAPLRAQLEAHVRTGGAPVSLQVRYMMTVRMDSCVRAVVLIPHFWQAASLGTQQHMASSTLPCIQRPYGEEPVLNTI